MRNDCHMTEDLLDPLTVIEQAFARIAQCPGFSGAVLATADGLVLTSKGTLQGDMAAACAASLSLGVGSTLATLGEDSAKEIMLWNSSQVWYQTRLSTSHLLLAASGDAAHSGALRLLVSSEIADLEMALQGL